MINTTLTNSSGQTAKVLREVDSGDGKKLLYLATSNLDAWEVGESFTSEGVSGTIEDVVAGDMASIYEARTEQQVLDEDEDGEWVFGWRFKELGWAVDFENGISLYGDLVALNQNRSGLGVQGPTTISGNNGRVLVLNQKVNITNKPTQVNGWKGSDTPKSFNLNAGHIANVDELSIYADAFISWSEESSEVLAPGITSSSLTEYPADNTVPVEID